MGVAHKNNIIVAKKNDLFRGTSSLFDFEPQRPKNPQPLPPLDSRTSGDSIYINDIYKLYIYINKK